MNIFLVLLIKLIPLYILILLGYVGGRYLKVQKEILSSLLIYILIPAVTFAAVINTKLSPSVLSIPILFFIICGLASVITYFLSGFIWKNSMRNLNAFIAGTANTGYFGIPVVIAIFGNNALSIIALALLGTSLYFNSFGFLFAATSKHSVKESLIKLAKLPILYAFFLGLLVNVLGVKLGKEYYSIENFINGAYTILGMMLIGIAISEIKKISFDIRFIVMSLFSKFLLWPIITMIIIFIDSHFLKLYDAKVYKIIILISILPLAVNIAPYATELKIHPEKASFAVFLSTLFALFYIPLFVLLFLK